VVRIWGRRYLDACQGATLASLLPSSAADVHCNMTLWAVAGNEYEQAFLRSHDYAIESGDDYGEEGMKAQEVMLRLFCCQWP
jgi:hypothetical protein